MDELQCKEFLQYFPSSSDLKGLYSTFIANCVFNIVLTYNAVILNITTMYAIRKTTLWPKTLRTLMLSLSVSDISVGLFVQPFYSSLLVNWLQLNNPNCTNYRIFSIAGNFFATASFLGVVAVGVDRFLAVYLHLRYQEFVTYKRVVMVVISIWVLSVFVSLMKLWSSISTQNVIILFVQAVSFGLTMMVYIRIYKTVQRQKNQIRSLQVQVQEVNQSGDRANFIGRMKSLVGIFYVYLVFSACYLPYFLCKVAIRISGSSVTLKSFHLFSVTLVFFNSSLNPVIYCWKMKHIRHVITGALRNISRNRNRAWH